MREFDNGHLTKKTFYEFVVDNCEATMGPVAELCPAVVSTYMETTGTISHQGINQKMNKIETLWIAVLLLRASEESVAVADKPKFMPTVAQVQSRLRSLPAWWWREDHTMALLRGIERYGWVAYKDRHEMIVNLDDPALGWPALGPNSMQQQDRAIAVACATPFATNAESSTTSGDATTANASTTVIPSTAPDSSAMQGERLWT